MGFWNNEEKDKNKDKEKEKKKSEKITIVVIDNENFRGSVKKINSQKNINYIEFIEFLKKKFAKDSKIIIYLVVSLLGMEKKKNDVSSGMQNFLRAMENLEIGFETNDEINFKLLEIPSKKERVYFLDQKKFGMAEVSQVDQKIINLFMKESLRLCSQKKCKFILVSGDGDFLETLNILRKNVTEDIIVISSRKSCNEILKRAFNVIFIEDMLRENPNVLLPVRREEIK